MSVLRNEMSKLKINKKKKKKNPMEGKEEGEDKLIKAIRRKIQN